MLKKVQLYINFRIQVLYLYQVRRMKNNKGFTMVELLAVIALIGILSAGAAIAITSTIARNKEKVAQQQKETILDAAVTYIMNKKLYVPICTRGSASNPTYVNITPAMVDTANKKIEENITFKGERAKFDNLNADKALQNVQTGSSGKFGTLNNKKCYKLVRVQQANNCVVAGNLHYSVIVVYAKGSDEDADGKEDTGGAGTLTAVASTGLCSQRCMFYTSFF